MRNEQYGIAIDSENFPDEVSREYVKTNFDKDNDGFLSEEEICNVCSIDVAEKEIYSLKGIEHFAYLTELVCRQTKIKELDVSNNSALKGLICFNANLIELNCSNTGVKILDVSKNTALKKLKCNNTRILKLDVSNNPALETLKCSGTEIKELDVRNNPDLISLWCSGTKLKELDVSNNLALRELHCDKAVVVTK